MTSSGSELGWFSTKASSCRLVGLVTHLDRGPLCGTPSTPTHGVRRGWAEIN
jgi:hypothetical protein